LAIRKTFCELKDGGEGKAHGSLGGLSVIGEEGRKVAILEDGAQSSVHQEIGVAFGKDGACNASGFMW
jgi:hypothetical protein